MGAGDLKNNSLKILIIDDDRSTRLLIAKFLENTWPCKILEAEDGVEAFRIILKDSPGLDLIILDMMLPYINGLEFLSIIRNKPELAHIPIIACTAIDEEDQVRQILGRGVDNYVVKPVNKMVLLRVVLEVFKKYNKLERLESISD